MEELLKKAKIDIPRLHRYFKMLAAFELSKLSEPCYYPPLKKPYHEILHMLQITDKDVKDFIKRNYKGISVRNRLLVMTDTNLLLFIMHIFLKERKKDAYEAVLTYHMIRQYSHLINRQIQFCNPELFSYALENLTKTHLFSREKTIGNSIMHLTREAARRFTRDILEWNKTKIEDFILISRHRIAQSVRSFGKHYYEASKQGSRIRTHLEPTDDEEGGEELVTLEKGKRVIDNTVKKITMYRSLDRKAFEESKKITKIRTSIADMIIREVHDLKYQNNIKTILQLFVKDATSTSMVCGKDYYVFVRKLMQLKRTRSRIYFKQQVNILLMKILDEKDFTKSYNSYTSQTQFIINSFLAYYLTMVLRNIIC
jgi:hypothetical protein